MDINYLRFGDRSKFKNSPLNMEFLTKEEVEDFRKAFNLFDNDGSGTISSRELITAMQNLNLKPKEEEIQNIIKVSNEVINLTCEGIKNLMELYRFRKCAKQIRIYKLNFSKWTTMGEERSTFTSF